MGDCLNYYIFGAHPRGWTLYQYLKTLEPERYILGFLYDNDEKNPYEIDGVRVIKLNSTNDIRIDLSAAVYIATRGVFHEKISNELKKFGFKYIIPVTPQFDTDLRNRYVNQIFLSNGRKFVKIDNLLPCKDVDICNSNNADSNLSYDICDAKVYIAKTIFDSDFKNRVDLKTYESVIQAGSSLVNQKLIEASDYDDTDENISSRNSQFCELTAFYWIWKHAKEDIIGLEHWRRRFLLPNLWQDIMMTNGIDVILPVPLCVMPSLEENYKCRHIPEIWDSSMDILKELHSDDFDNAESFFRNTSLYSPCNMIIAKREIISEYCEWLFPVLLKLNDEVGVLEDKYQNRYPGFLAERLLNYFFEKNRDRFRVAYADKSFLS